MFRNLNETERQILERLFEKSFEDRDTFRMQALNSRVEEWTDETGTLSFEAGIGVSGPHWIPVEGEYHDSDNNVVHILLHIVDNKVFELEFYKDAPGPILKYPSPQEVSLFDA